MKKLLIVVITIAYNAVVVNAQPLFNDIAFATPTEARMSFPALNGKVDKHFRREFKQISNETWSRNSDGYRARFTDGATRYTVDYNQKGQRVAMIKSYDPSLMSLDLKKSVLSAYLGYSIAWVVEVTKGNATVHLVKIEDDQNLKTIRVANGDMDVIEEYRRK